MWCVYAKERDKEGGERGRKREREDTIKPKMAPLREATPQFIIQSFLFHNDNTCRHLTRHRAL